MKKALKLIFLSKSKLPYLQHLAAEVHVFKDMKGYPFYNATEKWGHVYDGDRRLVIYTPEYIIYDKFHMINILMCKKRNHTDLWKPMEDETIDDIIKLMEADNFLD